MMDPAMAGSGIRWIPGAGPVLHGGTKVQMRFFTLKEILVFRI
jgi:hypothetical protein